MRTLLSADSIARMLPGLRRLAIVLVSAAIVAVGSERVFWFWSPGLTDHGVVILAYALPVAVTFWAIATYRVDRWWALFLATPLFAYLVEGWFTPVLYSGGPFVPVFPAWFAFWHGIFAFGLLLIGVRRWLLDGAHRRLAAVAVGVGVFWGLWSSTLRLPENVEDEELIADLGELTVLEPLAFARYAALFTVVLIVGHVVLDRLWMDRFEPRRPSRWVAAALVVVVLGAWTVAIPWALPMFAAYALLQWRGLRWHRAGVTALDPAAPDLFALLSGRIALRSTVPLLWMAPVAATTYWGLWAFDPGETALRVIMDSVIAVQAVAGAWLTVAALRRARQRAGTGARSAPFPVVVARQKG